jgi:hypothetical protein
MFLRQACLCQWVCIVCIVCIGFLLLAGTYLGSYVICLGLRHLHRLSPEGWDPLVNLITVPVEAGLKPKGPRAWAVPKYLGTR